MCYFGTNNPFLIYPLFWYSQPATEEHLITPNRPLRIGTFDSNIGHVKHAKHWKPSRRAWMCYIWPYNSILMSVLWGRLPTGQWGTPSYSQPATEERQLYGKIGHIKHWKPCLGTLMCHFGKNNPFLMYALCVILATGHWGTPHYPLTGHWGTAAFDCNLGRVKHAKHWKPSLGPRCVIFDHTIQSRCLSYGGDSQPASEEHPLLPTGVWGTAAEWSAREH